MKWLIAVLIILGISVGVFLYFNYNFGRQASFLAPGNINPEVAPAPTPKPLLSFTFENLSRLKFEPRQFQVIEEIEQDEPAGFRQYLVRYEVLGRYVTAVMNVPGDKSALEGALSEDQEKFPVIIMLRGYVDKEIYEPGVGTQHGAAELARNGFVTIAPDFFGFGGSDAPDSDVWWERFARPVQVLQLIASLPETVGVDTTKVGIWAHSNGGQLALSVLEITGAEIPTSLWAPVSKPFPYSVLYFTDEFEDEGKYIRGELSRLEQDYDVRDFSISDYFEKINAPIQIHQGTADDAVPYEWSEDLVAQLEENEVEVEYFEYAGADHNMVGSWDEVIRQDIEFFEEKLGN